MSQTGPVDWLTFLLGINAITNNGAPVAGSPGANTLNVIGATSIALNVGTGALDLTLPSGGASSGTFVKRTILTATSGTFTTQATTTKLHIRGCGGGGAGGGSASNTPGSSSAGGGGSAGQSCDVWVPVSPSTGYPYAVGVGGTGSSGADGTDGTASGIVIASVTLLLAAGIGGTHGTARTVVGATQGGSTTPGVSSAPSPFVGYLTVEGDGSSGLIIDLTQPLVLGGRGGSGAFGQGGTTQAASSAGVTPPVIGQAGSGYGAGGSGAAGGEGSSGGASAEAGGNGAPGVLIVDEYS